MSSVPVSAVSAKRPNKWWAKRSYENAHPHRRRGGGTSAAADLPGKPLSHDVRGDFLRLSVLSGIRPALLSHGLGLAAGSADCAHPLHSFGFLVPALGDVDAGVSELHRDQHESGDPVQPSWGLRAG